MFWILSTNGGLQRLNLILNHYRIWNMQKYCPSKTPWVISNQLVQRLSINKNKFTNILSWMLLIHSRISGFRSSFVCSFLLSTVFKESEKIKINFDLRDEWDWNDSAVYFFIHEFAYVVHNKSCIHFNFVIIRAGHAEILLCTIECKYNKL